MCECSVHIPLSAIKIFPLPGVLSGSQAAELVPKCPALACLSLLSQQCCQGVNNLLSSQVDNILPDISVCVLLCISAFLHRHLASLAWDFDLVVDLGNFILWRTSALIPWHMLLSQYRVCSNFPFFFCLPLHCLLSREICLLLLPLFFEGVGWPFFSRTSGLECLMPPASIMLGLQECITSLGSTQPFLPMAFSLGKKISCLLRLQVSGTPALIIQCLDNWYLSHSPISLSGLPDILPVCYNYNHSLCPLLYYYLLLLLFVVCLVPNK